MIGAKNEKKTNMDLPTFLKLCETLPNHKDKPLDDDQKKVISHGTGSLWVVAGPGSGKTDSIVLRCLKLLIVDRINPKSIVVTTFTEKAARNLEDRIGIYMQYFIRKDSSLRSIDYTLIRTGTLHSLGNDVMQEFRYSEYQNYRLLENLEEGLFILEHSSFCKSGKQFDQEKYKPIWENSIFQPYFSSFSYITNRRWSPDSEYPPNRWIRADFARKTFDTIVDEDLDVNQLLKSKDISVILTGELYKEYESRLESTYRVDFSHLQKKFLKFLLSSESKLFLIGDGTDLFPGIKYVLVDEYQDTNTIQEKIYLELARQSGNLCVVGDDDQALYRFRGGRVELMIRFPEACATMWPKSTTKTVYLHTNYRSHASIVRACNGYIKSFGALSGPSNRVSSKPDLELGSSISGKYPAAAIHIENGKGGRNSGLNELAHYFAMTVKGLIDNKIIEDLSEVALLMPSTRSNLAPPKAFMEALDNLGIAYYNPRGIPVLESEEVEAILGAFLLMVDRDNDRFIGTMEGVRGRIERWRESYLRIASKYSELSTYVDTVAANIEKKDGGVNIGANMLQLLYYITGFEPFITWLEDPIKSIHIGLVTQVFDAFSNVPSSQNPERMLGSIYTTGWKDKGGVSHNWANSFYFSLVSMLTQAGLTETEDEDISYPRGRVPIMTIHQSKGLEFPFVFVHGLSSWEHSPQDIMFERFLRKEGGVIVPNSTKAELNGMARQDAVRLYFVAYSRAQNALNLLAQKSDRETPGTGCGGKDWSIFRDLERAS